MKGAVIYQSRYGNCEQIARSLHKGLQESGADVTLTEVGSAGEPGADLDFLAIGSPTRAGRATGPVRRLIGKIGRGTGSGPRYIAFGTGLAKGIDKGPIAADYIQKALAEKGCQSLGQPFRAAVEGLKGPLVEGEVERAYEYGKTIGSRLAEPAAPAE